MRRKSISGLLKQTKSFQNQKNVLLKWGDSWYRDQNATINLIYKALKEDRLGDAYRYIRQLKTITDKKFTGLQNVINIVSDPERHLIDVEKLNEKIDISEHKEKNTAESFTVINPPAADSEKQDGVYSLNRGPNIDISNNKSIDIDEIIRGYNCGMTLTEIASYNNLGLQKVRKILITAGVFSSDLYDKIKDLRQLDKSDWEIMDLLDISKKTLSSYTPYKKGLYNLPDDCTTSNALAIRKSRKRKR